VEENAVITISERDIIGVPPVAGSIAVSDNAPWPTVLEREPPWPTLAEREEEGKYFLTSQSITLTDIQPEIISSVDNSPNETVISPAWLGRVKSPLRDLAQLPANWDSYGASPVDPRVLPIAETLIEWFAVDDMPPPDLFATVEGGVQMEWHIRRANVEIEITPDGTSIYFHDLNSGDPWTRPVSPADLQLVRRRLLERP
jgi:hypothetical protein